MNKERIYEGLYPYIRYNNGNWYQKKTIRSKWKCLENNKKDIIKILQGYISKLQLVISIDLENEYNKANNNLEEIMHDIESILYDSSL